MSKQNPDSDNYRFYHCHLTPIGITCDKVDGPYVLPKQDNTKLLFVPSYYPEFMDKVILKYKWIPTHVLINPNDNFKKV